MSGDHAVLVVEDEAAVADLYATWLREEYDVRVANDGSEALDLYDEAVDVVLLDRRMPGLSGDEVLDELADRGAEVRVAMVTAVEPDYDIVDLGFDDYLVKPVTREDLEATVADLVERLDYGERMREYFSVAAKVGALEAAKPAQELADSEEYDRLQDRLADLESAAGTALDSRSDFENAFRDLGGREFQVGE